MQKPSEIRELCRSNSFFSHTSGLAAGYAQANICILPKEYAFEFLLFCQRNPKPCPLIEVLEPGQRQIQTSSSTIDIATDVPKYRVYVDGELSAEPLDLSSYWTDDLVTFVIGCSYSFEEALVRSGLEIRHVSMNRNVPMSVQSRPN